MWTHCKTIRMPLAKWMRLICFEILLFYYFYVVIGFYCSIIYVPYHLVMAWNQSDFQVWLNGVWCFSLYHQPRMRRWDFIWELVKQLYSTFIVLSLFEEKEDSYYLREGKVKQASIITTLMPKDVVKINDYTM